MGKRIRRIAIFVFLIVGIGLLTYPYSIQKIYDKTASKKIENFEKIKQLEKSSELKETNETEVDEEADFMELYKQMQKYNLNLYENGQDGFRDAWSYQKASFDLTKWGFEDNIAGYIEIPRMEAKLPLYLGASGYNMSKGAVHLTETSLPIGGENTNCVIAAHRGYSRAAMFRNIEKLQIGDMIYVTNLWETLHYKAVEFKVIDPTEKSKVLIQTKRDLVTLITCHPYRQNYQRYVVYCERVH